MTDVIDASLQCWHVATAATLIKRFSRLDPYAIDLTIGESSFNSLRAASIFPVLDLTSAIGFPAAWHNGLDRATEFLDS